MIYDTTRTQRGDGRFLWQYTFHRATQPITYWFRVAIPASCVSAPAPREWSTALRQRRFPDR
jgi:hypothetical protein